MTRTLYKANRAALYSLRTWHVRHQQTVSMVLLYFVIGVLIGAVLSLFFIAADIVFTHEEVVQKVETEKNECYAVLNGAKVWDGNQVGRIEWSEVKPLVEITKEK